MKIEITAGQMVEALRRCGGTVECAGCPYAQLGTARCIQAMQKDAAALIEAQQAFIGPLVGPMFTAKHQ